VSEETIKDSDGNVYDVTDVTDDKTDIVIIKKSGKILEEQITNSDKVRIQYKRGSLKNGKLSQDILPERNDRSIVLKANYF
jgi:hypothetical protein